MLPELLIFESIPDNNTRTIVSLNSEEINSITQKLFESVTNSNFEVSNGILERIYSFDSNSILRFWNNPKSFQVLKVGGRDNQCDDILISASKHFLFITLQMLMYV